MPSLNGSRRRHSKHSSSSKKAPPPDLTLSSRYSSSSNNSDAQATPKSIFYSSLRPSRRLIKEPKPIPRKEPSPRKALESPASPDVDVFEYMEKDEPSEAGNEEEESPESDDGDDDDRSPSLPTAKQPISSPQPSPRYSDLEVKAIQDGVHRAWGRASLHSDSGISMHSSSPEQDSPIMHHKYPMIREDDGQDAISTTAEEDEDLQAVDVRESPDLPPVSGPSPQHYPSLEAHSGHVPEPCAISPRPPFPHHQDPPFPQLELPAPSYSRRRSRAEPLPRALVQPARKAGYDLLASNISSHQSDEDATLKPIYRKFETLNNRMLLYLQDEISEIEEQLAELDAAIAHEEADYSRHQKGHTNPASRRYEAKLPSQLQWHRLDLMHRSFGKVELYNKALTSYTTLIRTLSPASTSDIETYKTWIQAHTPVVPTETAFLDHTSDLLTVSPATPSSPSFPTHHTSSKHTHRRRSSRTTNPPSTSSHQSKDQTQEIAAIDPTPQPRMTLDSPFIVLAFAFVATIVVFRLVPSFIARLVIGALVGFASLCVMTPGEKGGWRSVVKRRVDLARVGFVVFVLACVVD